MATVATQDPSTLQQPPVESEEEHAERVKAQAEQAIRDLFTFSRYVHVGESAEECEHKEDGRCQIDGHFHAWIRLANPFQIRDIVEKARAAKARKVRALHDPESDAHVVLEADLDALRDPDTKQALVDEIAGQHLLEDDDEAERLVRELESEAATDPDEEEAPRLYPHPEQDREEYERQLGLPADQREEGFADLERHVNAYDDAVEKQREQLQEARRGVLREKSQDDLIEIVRRDRISNLGTEAYLHAYNSWQWFVCTYKPRAKGTPNERVWKDINQMKYEAPSDVILALKEAFESLEGRLAAHRAGNS